MFSSHSTLLHTRLIEFFCISLSSLSCLLYCRLNSLMDTLGGECLCLSEISINVNKLLAVLLSPLYLFIGFFLLLFVVASLLLYPFFYNDVAAIDRKSMLGSVKCEDFAQYFLRLEWRGASLILAVRSTRITTLKLSADCAKQFVRNTQNCEKSNHEFWTIITHQLTHRCLCVNIWSKKP